MQSKGFDLSTHLRRTLVLLAGLAVLAAVAALTLASRSTAASGSAGFVYTMSNAGSANAVLAYSRASDGTLTPLGTYPTGGRGTGQPRLGSQGPVVLTPNGRWLLVTNPGSDDVSVFAVASNGTLTLVDREPSNGDRPESVTTHGNLVYVLNNGSPNNISGYTLGTGGLTPLAGSVRPLSQEGALPAQVQFSPDGRTLVVTERTTNLIDTFRVNRTGRTSDVMPHAGSGVGPFGFAFRSDGVFVVTESFDGAVGQAAASSYSLANGFSVISGTVGDGQSDVCWAVISNDERYAYVTNNGSGTISSYTIAPDGRITLLQAVAGTTGDPALAAQLLGTRDADLNDGGEYLYAIDVGTLTITGFTVGSDGALTKFTTVGGFPSTFAGLAVS
jgi:6-phosphogluconolactonase (cycloisomerase 2 family)